MKFFLLLLLPFSLSSFALETENWKLLSSKTEKAKNSKQLKALSAKYPDLFRGLNVKKLSSASIKTVSWKYIGPHTCAEDDARLLYSGKGLSYCQRQGNAQACIANSVMPPFGDYNPCQFDP
jgi:hypothetical protein